MIDRRPRIVDVERKPHKCPVCGEQVVGMDYYVSNVKCWKIEQMMPKLLKMVEGEMRSFSQRGNR